MSCYACDQEATRHCSLCGNAYCGDHGDDVCASCLDPVNAAPSGAAFRVSVLALLFASVLALWLLVRPPALPGKSEQVSEPQPSPIAAAALPSPTPTPTPTRVPTPSPTSRPTPSPSATASPTPTPVPQGPIEYTVVAGDTLYGIAAAFGVDAVELAAVNGLTLNDFLHPGQILTIPAVSLEASPTPEPSPSAAPVPQGPIEYTVVAGDTLYGIAAAFGVDAVELAAVNGLTLNDFLHPGDVLVIPQ